MLVHFPICFWVSASLLDLLSIWLTDLVAELSLAAHLAGASTAVVVMVAGLLDSGRVKAMTPADRHLNYHMAFVFLAWCLYAGALFFRWNGETLLMPNGYSIAFSVVGLGCLVIGGWFGGQLVYQHGIGVKSDSPP